MRVLFLSRWFPFPADNGSKIRIANLLKALRVEHEVALVTFAAGEVSDSSMAAAQTICDPVRVVAYRAFRPDSMQARLGFFSPTPRSVIDTFSPEMLDTVERVAATWKPDLVIASQVDMMRYALAVKDATRVLEELELALPFEAFLSAHHSAARVRRGLTWWKLEWYLRRTLPGFDLCTVVSARERDLATAVSRGQPPVHVVPNGADFTALRAVRVDPEPGTLIYSGALSYFANYDAVAYFLAEIFPLILKQAPTTRLLVTGSTQGVALDQLPQCPNVHFTGYLEDIWPVVAGSWVAVVPLRLGGGTRLKVIEALALGTPVVSTSKGVEGLDLCGGNDAWVADDPQSFADKTLALLNNASLRRQLAAQGRRAVQPYDWTVIGRDLNALLADVAARRQSGVTLSGKL